MRYKSLTAAAVLSRHEPRKKKNRIKLKDNFEKSSRSFQSLDWRV